jgi:hypothetical protein
VATEVNGGPHYQPVEEQWGAPKAWLRGAQMRRECVGKIGRMCLGVRKIARARYDPRDQNETAAGGSARLTCCVQKATFRPSL